MDPAASTATAYGFHTVALAAEIPSPLKPALPVPASVVICCVKAFTLRIRLP
jgi:hypothetical protein